MTLTTETPETDAHFPVVPGAGSGRVIGRTSDFCRKLERERDHWRAETLRLRKVIHNTIMANLQAWWYARTIHREKRTIMFYRLEILP